MRTLLAACFVWAAVVSAWGQGQFLFNTRDNANGNDVNFSYCGVPANGSDLFVEVIAGPTPVQFQPLLPLMPLNQSNVGAGYPQPFAQVFTTPFPAGTQIFVGYRGFRGSSWNTAIEVFNLVYTKLGTTDSLAITLTGPAEAPFELNLGTGTVSFSGFECVPEPLTWTLCLIGLGTLSLRRRRGDSA